MGIDPRQVEWYGTEGWTLEQMNTPELELALKQDEWSAQYLEECPLPDFWVKGDMEGCCEALSATVLGDLDVSLLPIGWGVDFGYFVLRWDGLDSLLRDWLEGGGEGSAVLPRQQVDAQIREAARRIGMDAGALELRDYAYFS